MNEKKMFTLGIASYNNYKFLYEAVDSVLSQNYEKIELIISNDGSDDFNQLELEKYINNNKQKNIVSVKIFNSEINRGTVKNINHIAKNANGEYIMFMAADDAFYDNDVISNFVKAFEENKDWDLISAKISMCGTKLDEEREVIPDYEKISLIISGNTQKMFSKLSYDSFMPTTSTCYRMKTLVETDFFDERYFIIEDAPKFLNLARLNYKFGWCDIKATRHRDGGISHGNNNNNSETYRRYRFDEILLYTVEILPYMNLIEENDLKRMKNKWNYLKGAYYLSFLKEKDGELNYREYDYDILNKIVDEIIRSSRMFERKEYIKKILFTRGGKVSMAKELWEILGVLFSFWLMTIIEKVSFEYNIVIVNNSILTEGVVFISYIILFVLMIHIINTIIIRILFDLYKLYKRMKNEEC